MGLVGKDDLGSQAKYQDLCDCAKDPTKQITGALPEGRWVEVTDRGTDDRHYKVVAQCAPAVRNC